MTKKQTPHVVISAIWERKENGDLTPCQKESHFVMARDSFHASEKMSALLAAQKSKMDPIEAKMLGTGRQVWLTRDKTDQYDDEAQKLVDACFADHA